MEYGLVVSTTKLNSIFVETSAAHSYLAVRCPFSVGFVSCSPPSGHLFKILRRISQIRFNCNLANQLWYGSGASSCLGLFWKISVQILDRRE